MQANADGFIWAAKKFVTHILHRPGVIDSYHRPRSPVGSFAAFCTISIVCVMGGLVYGFFFAILPPSFYVLLTAPVAVLSLVVIWALPDVNRPPHKIVEFLFWGFLVSLAVWPNYLALAFPGLPWITSNRLFTLPLVLSFLIMVSTHRVVRQQISFVLAKNKFTSLCLGVFITLQVLTIGFSSSVSTSVTRVVDFTLDSTLIFLSSIWVFRTDKSVRTFMGLCIAFTAYQAAMGLSEGILNRLFWAPWVPDLFKGDAVLVNKILAGAVRVGVWSHRAQSTWTTSLSYAEFLAISTPFLLAAIVYSRKPWKRIAAAIVFPGAIMGVYFSEARLGWVGGIAGACAFMFLVAARMSAVPNTRNMLQPAALLFAPIAASMIIALTFVSTRMRNMVWGAQHTEGSNESRQLQYSRGFEKLFEWPFGYGSGRAAAQIGQTDVWGNLQIDTYYMMIALDFGVIGFFAFYLAFLSVIVRSAFTSIRRPPADLNGTALLAASCALAVFVVTKSVLSQEDTHPFVFIIMGFAMTVAARTKIENGRFGIRIA